MKKNLDKPHIIVYNIVRVFETDGVLAQVVEHLTFNQVVRGSSPRYLTEKDEIQVGRLGSRLFL